MEGNDSSRFPDSRGDEFKRHNAQGGGRRDRSPVHRGRFRKPEQQQQQQYMDEFNVVEPMKKKFTGRCRLFVGNLPNDLKEDELRDLFKQYGEVSECFLSGKGFAFVRLDTRANAEVAKELLDGFVLKGRAMRVRFAVHGAAIKVKELTASVSNELLYQAFCIFGDVERAVHIVDEKGRPTGEGIVEFERKPGALDALRRINDGIFLMTSNPKPVYVEPLEPKDEEDGLAERMLSRNPVILRERSQPPRFASHGSFEYDFGNRWKELYQLERIKREQLEQQLKEARQQLENDMELAYQDYQAMLLREDLRVRQEELERLEAARRDRIAMTRFRDDDRSRGIPPGGVRDSNMNFGGEPFLQSGNMSSGGGPFQRPDESQATGNATPRENNIVYGVQKLLQMFQNPPPSVASGQSAMNSIYPAVYSKEMSQMGQQLNMSEYYGDGTVPFRGSGNQNVRNTNGGRYGGKRRR